MKASVAGSIGILGGIVGTVLSFFIINGYFFPGGNHQGEKGNITNTNNMRPPKGEPIRADSAGKFVARYHIQNPKIILRANDCDSASIAKILATPGCKGIRIYRATDTYGELGVILVGIDSKRNDMIDQIGEIASEKYTVIQSYGKCPYNCDNAKSPLDLD